ncbi:MAG: DUF5711 family protein [Oscillospiraceae bacterium]|jgi:hypothetical protein|nr:DUF5711 family protein [Oscillospiraceae bacterium]
MKETDITQNETEEARQPRGAGVKRVFAFVLLAVVVAVMLVVYFKGGSLTRRGFLQAWDAVTGRLSEAAFAFEPGFDSVFADLGGTIAAAGSAGVAVYGKTGDELARSGFSAQNPAIAASGGLAIAYDVGGKSVRIVNSAGEISVITLENRVVSCSVGHGGVFVICTDDSREYKGRARFYRLGSGVPELIYDWYSGEGYVLGAAVSYDGKRFAVTTLTARGGRIVLLDSDSTDAAGEYVSPEGAILEASFMRGGQLIARTASGITAIEPDGSGTVIYDLTGRTLDGYSHDGDSFLALHFTDSSGGMQGELVTIDLKGRGLGSIRTSRALVRLTASGDRVAALWSDGLDIYDKTLGQAASYPEASGAVCAFPRGGEAAVAMGSREGRAFVKRKD